MESGTQLRSAIIIVDETARKLETALDEVGCTAGGTRKCFTSRVAEGDRRVYDKLAP